MMSSGRKVTATSVDVARRAIAGCAMYRDKTWGSFAVAKRGTYTLLAPSSPRWQLSFVVPTSFIRGCSVVILSTKIAFDLVIFLPCIQSCGRLILCVRLPVQTCDVNADLKLAVSSNARVTATRMLLLG